MSEYRPVETMADLQALDADAVLAGYREGFERTEEPGSDKCRGYWHGWRNAQIDRGRIPPDVASARLVREYLGAAVNAN